MFKPKRKKIMKYVFTMFLILTLFFALNLLYKQISNISLYKLICVLKTIPLNRFIIALTLIIVYYIILGGYDIVAIKYITNHKVHIKNVTILLICFISNSIGNNLGYSMLFGGSLRYRLYSLYKMSVINITKVLLFTSISLWIGLITIGSIIFPFTSAYYKIDRLLQVIGIFFILIILIYCLFSILSVNKTIIIFNKTITIPNIKVISFQILFATLDWIISSLILYSLLYTANIKYLTFLKIFLISQFCSILSQVPGGIGIFETTIMLFLPKMKNNLEFIVGLINYRVLFYILPLIIGLMLLIVFETVNLIKNFNKTQIKKIHSK
ncbi:MAG: hypothetical protein LBM22_01135 [Endomicrobium sp.]|nr:hypothetical protein [Endomicrobium sp.]